MRVIEKVGREEDGQKRQQGRIRRREEGWPEYLIPGTAAMETQGWWSAREKTEAKGGNASVRVKAVWYDGV